MSGVDDAWRALGLPGDPPVDPADATLYVPVTWGAVRDSGERCVTCWASIQEATVYGMTRDSMFPIGTLRVCDCKPQEPDDPS